MKLHIDFETRSDVDLTKQGLENYVNSTLFDVMCMAIVLMMGQLKYGNLAIHSHSIYRWPSKMEILSWPTMRPSEFIMEHSMY